MCHAFHMMPTASSRRAGKAFQLVFIKGREDKERESLVAMAFYKKQLPSIMLNSLSRWPGVDSRTLGRAS